MVCFETIANLFSYFRVGGTIGCREFSLTHYNIWIVVIIIEVDK